MIEPLPPIPPSLPLPLVSPQKRKNEEEEEEKETVTSTNRMLASVTYLPVGLN